MSKRDFSLKYGFVGYSIKNTDESRSAPWFRVHPRKRGFSDKLEENKRLRFIFHFIFYKDILLLKIFAEKVKIANIDIHKRLATIASLNFVSHSSNLNEHPHPELSETERQGWREAPLSTQSC